MKSLLIISLAALAAVLASQNKKLREEIQSAESDYDEEDETFVDDDEAEEPSYKQSSLYSEPSSLSIPEKHEGDVDDFNRPEYVSDNNPDLTIDALRSESNM